MKTYKLTVSNGETGLFGKEKTEKVDNQVLKSIDLTVRKGEVLGILGRNGSGKSTLLKIISHITEPDSGTVETSGKLASILELGMGFHPDMSGRENVYLKGELYGFSKEEIDKRIDDIIEYSGIDRYIDNPVRTYSSGMVGRLAFAVMVGVDADIMLVDEILSIGDASFAAKATDHFRKLSKSGKTVLMVSHNLAAVEDMCTRAIWIDDGRIVMDGTARKVVSEYRSAIENSFDVVTDMAECGVADAQYRLAQMYRDGRGTEKSQDKYDEWIKKAALEGNSQAQCEYADLLIAKGTEESRKDATEFYRSSATAGNPEAMMKFAELNAGSIDSDRDRILSIYKQLAERGNPIDEYRYADLILRTARSRDDREKALKWFIRSSDHGNITAMNQAGIMYRDGIGTAKDIGKAIEFLQKAAEGGRQASIMNLADMYWSGRLVPKDEAKAFHWYQKAAEMGNGKAQYMLAVMYRDGLGTEKNQEESVKWFRRFSSSAYTQHQIWAADALKYIDLETDETPASLYSKASAEGNSLAKVQLGLLYRDGSVELPDADKAVQSMREAEAEYSYTLATVADYLYKGYGGNPDFESAFRIYSRYAASTGDATAYYRLALMYRDGRGTEKDEEAYRKCLIFAAEKGNRDALAELDRISPRRGE